MRRLLLALALAACPVPIRAAAAEGDCHAAPDLPAAGAAERHLAEARCWLAHSRYAAALLAAERFLALRPGDSEGETVRAEALRRMEAAPLTEQVGRPVAQGWIALQAGYDTNANLGTDAEKVRIPLRLRLPAIETEDLRRRSSSLLGVHGGFEASVPVSRRNRLRLVGIAAARANPNAYVSRNYALETHAEHRGDSFRPGLWLGLEERWLSKYHVLKAQTLGGRFGFPVTGRRHVELFHAVTPKDLPLFELDTIERVSGISLDQPAFGLRLTLFRGSERARGGPSFLDREFTGASAETSTAAGPGRLHMALQHVRSNYTVFSRPFLLYRLDEFSELHAAYEYPLSGEWRVVPRVVLQHNRSNIVVTAYERVQWLLELRRQF